MSPPLPPLLDHAEVAKRLTDVATATPDLFARREDRRVARGARDQSRRDRAPAGPACCSGRRCTATSRRRRRRCSTSSSTSRGIATSRWSARILSQLTLHVVPMLNPDGAERFQRRNAQSIDINRDALRLQTPEGRALKALRDRLNPAVGFNLHNQSWRTSVGTPPKPASISLLSVAYDEAAHRERRPQADQAAVRGDSRRARAAGLRARSAAMTTSSRCGRSATTSRCGGRRWC